MFNDDSMGTMAEIELRLLESLTCLKLIRFVSYSPNPHIQSPRVKMLANYKSHMNLTIASKMPLRVSKADDRSQKENNHISPKSISLKYQNMLLINGFFKASI